MNSHTSRLAQAEQLGREILALADRRDWERLAEFEPRWNEVVRQCFAAGQSIDFAQAVKLKELNDAILQRLADERLQLMQLKLQLNQGGRASRAYLGNAPR